MTPTVTPVGLLLETLGSMTNTGFDERAPITARVLEVVDHSTARVRILGVTLDMHSPIPVKPGMLLKMLPQFVDGQLRLVLLPGTPPVDSDPPSTGPGLLPLAPADTDPMHEARAIIAQALSGAQLQQPQVFIRSVFHEGYGQPETAVAATDQSADAPPTNGPVPPGPEAAQPNLVANSLGRTHGPSQHIGQYLLHAPGLAAPIEIEIRRDEPKSQDGNAEATSTPLWSIHFTFRTDDIGEVRTVVQQTGPGIRVDFRTERGDTAAMLQSELQDLRDILSAAALDIEALSVSTDAAFIRLVNENE